VSNRQAMHPADAAIVNGAARLARYCAGYLADLADREAGWQVFFAVDTDIVGMYMNPEARPDYADVFDRGDPLLARLIGDFLLREMEPQGHLFVVPPHDEQITRMVLKVSENYVKLLDSGDSGFSRFTTEMALQLEAGARDDIVDWLIDNANELIEVFDGGSGAIAELSRFSELGEDRLMNVEQYVEPAGAWSFPLPNRTDALQDLGSMASRVETWRHSLTVHKSRKQRRYSIDEDAVVLATIEWLNEQMEADRRKIVLVTGTSGIWAAAADPRHEVSTGVHAGRRFADAYVRHPMAFLASRDFFFPRSAQDPGGAFNLIDWLNLVFPSALSIGASGSAVADVSLLPVPASARTAGTSTPSSGGQDVLADWNTQVRAAAVVRKVSPERQQLTQRAERFVDWLSERMDTGWTLQQLRLDISSRAVESLNSLYSSTVFLGLWHRLRRLPEHARGIPSLRFEAPYEKGQAYCRVVLDSMYADPHAQSSSARLDLQSIYAELAQVDPSNYMSHVIHALAYATKGHWYATQTLCRIALRVADGLPDDARGNRRGREAAYLLAVAERRSARTLSHLESARVHLQQAIDRQDPDRPHDIRFTSEGLSQDVAFFNFRLFVDKQAEHVKNSSQSLVDRGVTILMSLEAEPLPEVRAWTTQQIVTNVLNVSLAAVGVDPSMFDAMSSGARTALECARAIPIADPKAMGDGVAMFIRTAAVGLFAESADERDAARRRLPEMRFAASRPFDAAREVMYRQLAVSERGNVQVLAKLLSSA